MTDSLTIIPIGEVDDVSPVTALLNLAYTPLAEAGMKYVASWQDDTITLNRFRRGTEYVAFEDHKLVGTITLSDVEHTKGCPWYDRDDVCKFGQSAVLPAHQRQGIGRQLLRHVEKAAVQNT